MTSKDTSAVEFEYAVRKALENFKRRMEQQLSFQIQNVLLKQLQEEIKIIDYCASEKLRDLSLEYEDFYGKSQASGRSYENIVAEKNLVDTYSALEKFLFDCFYALYFYFPALFLGPTVSINTLDLFLSGDVELCKRNIVELQVKSFIQAKNIREVISEFDKKFSFHMRKKGIISEEEISTLHEIALIRNVIIHNNSIVNRVYKEDIRKSIKCEPKYKLNEGETVLGLLPSIADDLKAISIKICEKIAEFVIQDSHRLEQYYLDKIGK